MAWNNLGTLSPSYDWQLFDIASLSTSVFRLTHQWFGENPGRILIRSQFGDNVSAEVLIFYPDESPQVFVFRQDPELISINLGVRYLQCRMPNSSRIYVNTNWSVRLEEWVD